MVPDEHSSARRQALFWLLVLIVGTSVCISIRVPTGLRHVHLDPFLRISISWSMLASCCGPRVRASYGDLKSGRGMDELSVKLRDGQPGTLRCDTKVVELLGSKFRSSYLWI